MNNFLALLARFAAWAFGLFVNRTRQDGATEEREKISKAAVAHKARQDEVAAKPVSKDALQKSLKDGTF